MAEALIKRLCEKVKCGLCQEILYIPKTFPCLHSYCQFCLDGIVSFDENGKGCLKCPMKDCEQMINLTCKEVVAMKLKTNIMFQDMIDTLKEHDQGYVICMYCSF